MVKVLLFFYSLFSLLSHHFILFFFSHLSFFLRHSYQPLIFSSFTLFSSHCRCFSLFLLALLRHLLNLMSISIAVVFFFFFKWFDGCVRQWVGSDGDGQISDGGLQWVNSVMGRSLLCFLFFYGGGFGVLLWWFWCDSGGVLMGGWVNDGWVSDGSGWVCEMRLGCVFCCCFCFSVVVVLVFCYGGSGVRRWWGRMWGIDGCW